MEKKMDDVVNDNIDTNNGISDINETITPETKNDDDNMNRGLLSSSNDGNNDKELYYSVIGSNNNGYNSSDDDNDNNDDDDDNNDSLTDHEPLDDDEFGEFNEYEPLNDDVLEEVADNAMSSLTIDYQRTINQSSNSCNNINANTNANTNNQIIEEELPIINEEDNNDNIDSVNDINITRKVVPPSIPPLNADKIDAIKLAMSKLKLTTRPGAEGICAKILQSKLRVGDEHL